MPSLVSTSVLSVLDSSTVITPSLPTFSIASAIKSPISWSLAEIDATCAILSLVSTFFLNDSISATAISTAFSMPCLICSGLLPAVTLRKPSRMIACASTVAVVVPSPAMSLVLEATSLTSWAPMFSKASGSSISLAMVTPSLVIVGEPNFLSSTTLRPLGPIVTLTASARMFAPRSSARRALSSNTSCFAAMIKFQNSLNAGRNFVDDGQDVFFGDDEVLGAVDLDFASRILTIEHAIANLDAHRELSAVVERAASADRADHALLGLLLSGIGQKHATGRLVLLLDVLDNDVIVQRLEIHRKPPTARSVQALALALSAREREPCYISKLYTRLQPFGSGDAGTKGQGASTPSWFFL